MFLEQQNQHIRIISEGSCDTDDWSNDGKNYISKYIQIKTAVLNCNNISQYNCY